MKLIFLDIDGVLNQRGFVRGVAAIDSHLVLLLNRALDATNAHIVISSMWRQLIYSGDMTVAGFGEMLKSHGLRPDRVIGATSPEYTCTICDSTSLDEDDCCRNCRGVSHRGEQIRQWRRKNNHYGNPYVVVDDMNEGISDVDHPFVQTNSAIGLTHRDVDAIIAALSQ